MACQGGSSSSAGACPRLRWAVDAGAWCPEGGAGGAEFRFLLGLLGEEDERAAVLKFQNYDDQKRALISRLLVRQACALALGHTSFREFSIARTKGRKPFLASPLPDLAVCPNWNFNCSHDGRWVICASEPLCLVGADVAEPRRCTKGGREIDFRADFEAYLSPAEWAIVDAAGPDLEASREVFTRFWSAKEAFVKARGDGLTYPVRKAEFHWTPLEGFPAGSAYEGELVLEGKVAPLWRFVQHKMPGEEPCWATVGRGPITDIVDARGDFQKTMRKPQEEFTEQEWREALHAESPPFDVLPVAALVPPDAALGYADACGARGP